MAYAKHVFQKGEILTADQMNHIENGIEALDTAMLSKVEAVTGKGLSTNDYTDAEKTKLAGIAEGAGNYTLPEASNDTLGGVYTTYGPSGGWSYSGIFAETQMVNLGTKRTLRAILPYATSKVGGYGIVQAGDGLQMPYNGRIDMKEMTGATASKKGSIGAPPVPQAVDRMKYLRGDGTWDDLRSVIYNCYPVAWAPMDNGAHGWWDYDENGWMIPNDAANNVPPQVMKVALLTGPDISYNSLTLSFSYLNMISYEPITINFVELLGHPFSGDIVEIDSNGIVIAGERYAKSYNIPMRGGMIVKADQVCSFQIAYRQDPLAVIQALENRIAALENAQA